MSYTRWGKLTCPPGRERAYDGAIVGSKYNEGGSSEFLCLHKQPDFLPIVPGSQDERSRMFGTELRNYVGHHEKIPALSHLVNHEISCSVCYASSRSAMIIVPGRKTCPRRGLESITGTWWPINMRRTIVFVLRSVWMLTRKQLTGASLGVPLLRSSILWRLRVLG